MNKKKKKGSLGFNLPEIPPYRSFSYVSPIPPPMPTPPSTRKLSFDPNGDVVLILTKNSVTSNFLVNSHLLCFSSPVFKAMLGVDSQFAKESQLATARATGTPMELRLEDGDPEALETILWAIHSRFNKVPKTLTELQLYEIAIFSDKYDMQIAISVWVQYVWIPPLRPASISSLGDRWLFMSYAFGLKDIFEELTAEFIRKGKMLLRSTNQGVSDAASSTRPSILKHVPDSVLEAIDEEIFQNNKRALKHLHELLGKYMAVNEPPQCKNGGNVDCDAVILGYLIRALLSQSLYPLPDPATIPTDFDFTQIRTFIKGLATRHVSSTFKDIPLNSYMKDRHEHTCTPIPNFIAKIEKCYERAPGLEYGKFVSENLS